MCPSLIFFVDHLVYGFACGNVFTGNLQIEVVAYSGYKANEKPISFVLDGCKRNIENIIDRWYGVEHDYFKVVADDGKIYLLRWQRYQDLAEDHIPAHQIWNPR